MKVQFFEVSNQIEAGLWIAMGAGFIAFSPRATTTRRRHSLLAGAMLILFGLSDLVEAQSGAWWRPWWLLLWKGACVLVLLALAVIYLRSRRRPRGN